MNGPQEPGDALSPAELRLGEHLELLRGDTPQPSTALVKQIIHTARWQQAIRRPLLVVGALASAVAEGFRLLLGARRRRS